MPSDEATVGLEGTVSLDNFVTATASLPVRRTVSLGAVDGRVQAASERGSLRFSLYDTLHDRAITCYLSAEDEHLITDHFGKRVVVEGEVTRDAATGRALSVRRITNVTPIPEMGRWRNAIGAAPRPPNGPSPEAAIRRLRDAE